ncbi:hypothetical protein HC022_04230 [Salipiger sp. HF18]|uniref:hypothetical protein n=1 Tax=Salipiger sp. HF18 TaxID=2721557 RepID=UPI00142DB63D|nr:hypothetical protein [Salipiger sp. HF18]
MDIFSKRDGPRSEDVRAKRLISENAGTIRKLADQISNGGFTKMRQDQARRREAPKPEGLLIYDLSAPSSPAEPDPHVRISLNGRVVLVDRNSGRQLQLLGELRRTIRSRKFVLATEDNGFLSPVSDDIRAALEPLENAELGPDLSEDDLRRGVSDGLGLTAETDTQRRASDAEAEKDDGTPDDDSSELL